MREQGASISAFAATVTELQATVANLVSMCQTKDEPNDTAEPPTKIKKKKKRTEGTCQKDETNPSKSERRAECDVLWSICE